MSLPRGGGGRHEKSRADRGEENIKATCFEIFKFYLQVLLEVPHEETVLLQPTSSSLASLVLADQTSKRISSWNDKRNGLG